MPPFPSNALPSEFQEEHGSLELDGEVDNKPTTTGPTHYDVDDEDLDIANADQRVWLCKVGYAAIDGGREHVGDPRAWADEMDDWVGGWAGIVAKVCDGKLVRWKATRRNSGQAQGI